MKFRDLEPGTIFRWADWPSEVLNLRMRQGYMRLEGDFRYSTSDALGNFGVIVVPPEECPELIEIPLEELEKLQDRFWSLEDELAISLQEYLEQYLKTE